MQLLAALVFSSAAWGQGTYLVNPADPTAYQSITEAVAAATASGLSTTIVQIEGMADVVGPVPYSQSTTFEAFPISLPAGCTVKSISSTAVFVWDSSGGVTRFFEISQSGGATVVVQGINFMGGENAIYATASTGGQKVKALIQDCRFTANQCAVTALSTGGSMEILVKDCLITDKLEASSTTLMPVSPQAGFRFHAQAGGSPGSVTAGVVDLGLVGTFPSMDPQPAILQSLLSQGFNYSTTRLIEVWSEGAANFTQHPGALSGNYSPSPITEVHLTVQGGDWVQDATLAGGWDTAIHGEAFGGFGSRQFWDYSAGYRISASGVKIDGFDEDGVYGGTYHCGRGNIALSSSTLIARTGKGQAVDERRHSGVHLFSLESYSGLVAANSSFKDNGGNGIYANTEGNFAADEGGYTLVAPMGIYLGMKKCRIHENDANGVFLRNYSPIQDTGFIGGTVHQDLTSAFNIESDGEGFNVPHGQGVITQSAISNNGMAGLKVRGDSDNGGYGIVGGPPMSVPAGVALRLSDSFVWNNPMGGVDIDWQQPSELRAGLILVPVTHCTFVGNGSSGTNDWNMEINDHATSLAERATFGWYEPAGSNPFFMRTVVWNSIFTRDIATGVGADFGPFLNQNLTIPFSVIDKGPLLTSLQDSQIGFAGVRGKAFWGNATYSTTAKMTDEIFMPFLGPYNMFSLDPNQFHLAPGLAIWFIDNSPGYVRVEAPETAIDFGGQTRPGPTTGLRDKGADEQ